MNGKQKTDGIRLNKYLSSAGVCSRREADRLIESGRVRVDGVPAQQGAKVTAGQDVTVDGRPVRGGTERVVLAVYKRWASSVRRTRGQRTISSASSGIPSASPTRDGWTRIRRASSS